MDRYMIAGYDRGRDKEYRRVFDSQLEARQWAFEEGVEIEHEFYVSDADEIEQY